MPERDPILTEIPQPDHGDTAHPHGDKIDAIDAIDDIQNASRRLPEVSDDPDNDRPAK